MSVWEYSLQFDCLARYAPTIVAKMEDQVHRFVMGLESHLLNNCMLISLQPDIDISRIQAYAQGVDERKQKQRSDREHDRGHSKRAISSSPSGFTLSYVTLLVASKVGIELELVKPFEVSIPVGDPVIARQFDQCPSSIHGFDEPCVQTLSRPVRDSFPGHIISGEGIWVNTQKIEAVKTWPRPTTPMESFQALKDRVTSALVVTLPEGTDGYAIYCDASGVGLGCVLMHHGKANVVADALSRRSMGSLSYLQPEKRGIAHDIYQLASLGVRLLDLGLPRQVMGETHYSRYSVHPGATKIYHDIREIYWWDRIKKDIAEFVAQLTARRLRLSLKNPVDYCRL
ncbi:uncharacterized protein [Nicotiana tomentosiformis]|uniref:uncharacterized protein n=1 Tax=Nicotiana tomentosiformis TaxID=4098 RepID=UPI00388C7772